MAVISPPRWCSRKVAAVHFVGHRMVPNWHSSVAGDTTASSVAMTQVRKLFVIPMSASTATANLSARATADYSPLSGLHHHASPTPLLPPAVAHPGPA